MYSIKCIKHGVELFDWIEGGGYIYLCGAREPMSVDVENTLLKIIEEHAPNGTDAEEYLSRLKEEGRYQKDVY